jgi:SNF2 family DNA or RNA helicase
LALSGTPIEQSPIDVWAQMRFIEPTCFGDRWEDFENEYVKRAGFMGHEKSFRLEKLPQFLARIKPYCLRIELSEVAKVDSEFHIERFDLLGKQAKLYRELDEDMVSYYGERRVMRPLRVSVLIALQQITGGFLTHNNGDIVEVGQAKQRRVRRLIEAKKVTPPFVIFCRFKPEVMAMEAEMKKHFHRVEVLWGKTGHRNNKSQIRGELNRRFQNGEIDVLVCQTKTGSLGIDLFSAAQAILYSMGFSYIDWAQTKSRLLRRGQKRKVDFYFLCAAGTIDEDIATAIEEKSTVSRVVLSRLKRRR